MSRKNDFYLYFWGGLIMLVVGLFFLSQKVTVTNSFWGGGIRLMGMHISSGLVIVPFIFSLVWMFIRPNKGSKIAMVLSVLSEVRHLQQRVCLLNFNNKRAGDSLKSLLFLISLFCNCICLTSCYHSMSCDKTHYQSNNCYNCPELMFLQHIKSPLLLNPNTVLIYIISVDSCICNHLSVGIKVIPMSFVLNPALLIKT